MPRKASQVEDAELLWAPPKVWKTLEKRKSELRSKHFVRLLTLLRGYTSAADQLIVAASNEGAIEAHEKRQLIMRLHKRVGKPLVALDLLAAATWPESTELRFRAIAKQSGLDQSLFCPELSPAFRGKRLMESAAAALKITRPEQQPDGDPYARVILRLSRMAIDSLMAEFSRLGVLKVCKHCGGVYFPAMASKRACSVQYEGRNCGGNARSNKSYHLHK